jgi:hypothetical protein
MHFGDIEHSVCKFYFRNSSLSLTEQPFLNSRFGGPGLSIYVLQLQGDSVTPEVPGSYFSPSAALGAAVEIFQHTSTLDIFLNYSTDVD